jgi:Trpc4-associated protein
MIRAENIVDRNHAILFHAPDILKRLLLILRVQNNVVLSPSSLQAGTTNSSFLFFSQQQQQEFTMSMEFALLLSQVNDRNDWQTMESVASNNRPHITTTQYPPQQQYNQPYTFFVRNLLLRHTFGGQIQIQQQQEQQEQEEEQEEQEEMMRIQNEMMMMKTILLAPYRVEVLFIFCTLLNGKKKKIFKK